MKIGVALSGCDIGGVCAHSVLHWLQQEGVLIDFVSASGTTSPAALLFACGFEENRSDSYLSSFLQQRQQNDLDYAVADLSLRLASQQIENTKRLSVNALDLVTNCAVGFTNDFFFDTGTLHTFPLTEPYEALSASIGSVDGLCSFLYNGCRLCDYSAQYGCPYYPLHLYGCEKILSFSFEPNVPTCPYDILIKRRIADTCGDANLHISLEFPLSSDEMPISLDSYKSAILFSLEQQKTNIFDAVLF